MSTPASAKKKYYAKKYTSANTAYTKRVPYKRLASSATRTTIRGKGDYSKDYGKRLGSVVGEGLQELLTQLGGLGTATKVVSGMGSYAPVGFTVKSNKLAEGNDPPEVINGKEGSFIIRHREYIKDIYSAAAGAFTNESFPINPGNKTLFPWLSTIARGFEQFKVEGLIFEFRSNYGEATTGAMGSVVMATEYDVNRDDFVNKLQMENHQYASSCKPSLNMLHPIECARSQTPITELYVCHTEAGIASASDDQDPRFCDLGKFQIASVGVTSGASANLGELWCTYQIRFLKPRYYIEQEISGAFWQNSIGIATSTPFGTLANLTKGRGNNLLASVSADGTVTFPAGTAAGTYYVSGLWASSVATAMSNPGMGTFVNCSAVALDDPFAALQIAPNVGEVVLRKYRGWSVTLTGNGIASFRIDTVLPASANFMRLFITQMPDDLATQIPASVSAFIAAHLKQSFDLSTPTEEDVTSQITQMQVKNSQLTPSEIAAILYGKKK